MIPLKVASDGYLSTTKKVLIIAVAGYLSFGGTIPEPIIPQVGQVYVSSSRDEGGAGLSTKELALIEFRNRIVNEDEEILFIIKIYTEQCL